MKILKTVAVKQILTATSKKTMLENFEEQMFQFQKECEQLRFEMRRQEREKKYDKNALRQKFEQEIERRQEKIRLLEYQIEQLNFLPLGSELDDGEVDMILNIEVGDDWQRLAGESAILVKNGKVFDIR